LRDDKTPPPPWATVIAWAERFGCKPWEIEEEITAEWYYKIDAYDTELKRYREERAARAARKRR
jgi:hypothetical protein